MTYYVATTSVHATKAQYTRINREIQKIDPQAEFCTLSAPGNATRGWIARPNDGTNALNHVRERNNAMAAIMRDVLGIT